MMRACKSKVWLSLLLAVWLVPAAALAQAPDEEPLAEPPSADEAAPPPADEAAPPQADEMAEPEPGPAADQDVTLTADTEEAEAEPEEPTEGPGSFVLAVEIGGFFPFDNLGIHVRYGVEVGYLLPFLDRRLEVMVSAGYAEPRRDFDDGDYHGEVHTQELTASLGPRFRFLPLTSSFNLSLAAGPRLFFLRSKSTGKSMPSDGTTQSADFAEFKEQSMEVGVFAALGAEYFIGPGAILLDVDLGWSKLPHTITGADEATTNVSLTLGYRFFIP